MTVTKEVAKKMGMIPSDNTAVQLRNICLLSVYQRNQRAIDACESYEDVVRLGVIPKNLQKPENFRFRSSCVLGNTES